MIALALRCLLPARLVFLVCARLAHQAARAHRADLAARRTAHGDHARTIILALTSPSQAKMEWPDPAMSISACSTSSSAISVTPLPAMVSDRCLAAPLASRWPLPAIVTSSRAISIPCARRRPDPASTSLALSASALQVIVPDPAKVTDCRAGMVTLTVASSPPSPQAAESRRMNRQLSSRTKRKASRAASGPCAEMANSSPCVMMIWSGPNTTSACGGSPPKSSASSFTPSLPLKWNFPLQSLPFVRLATFTPAPIAAIIAMGPIALKILPKCIAR